MAVRLGPYTLLRKLAVGGMAELYLARREGPEGFQKLAVVKRILPQYAADPDFVGMFLDEARLAARLDHPNIVHIYDLGKTATSFFIAMEYVAGEDLRSIQLQARQIDQPLPEGHMVRVFAEIAAALHHAHTRTDDQGRTLGLVHRDVSPQNILVSYEGAVKLTDFGIAKAVSQVGVTKDGVLKGKHAYLSPEQVMGQTVDHRSDVFALGICLYEFATRTRLFKRDHELAMVHAIAEEPITPPRKIRPTIAGGLEEIIMIALEKDPAKRFSSAQQMQVALERFGRDAEHQVGAVELADYMKELFADKIRAQKEAAAQARVESFEALLLEGEGEPSGFDGSLPGLHTGGTGKSGTSGLLYGEAESAHRASGMRRWWPLAAAVGVLAAAVGGGLVLFGSGSKGGDERAKVAGIVARAPGEGGTRDRADRDSTAGGGRATEAPDAVKGGDVAPSSTGGEREVGLLYVSAATYDGPALIYLDGKLEGGRLPITLSEVVAGTAHVLRVEVEGFEPHEAEERVEARRTTNVDVKLKPRVLVKRLDSVGASDHADPKLPPKVDTTMSDPKMLKKKGSMSKGSTTATPAAGTGPTWDTGSVTKTAAPPPPPVSRVPVFFDARPWAAVHLDGRKLCTTPCYYDLLPGTYTFTFRHDPAKLEKKATVKVAPSGANKVIVDLK